jgi:hypothetical protein
MHEMQYIALPCLSTLFLLTTLDNLDLSFLDVFLIKKDLGIA